MSEIIRSIYSYIYIIIMYYVMVGAQNMKIKEVQKSYINIQSYNVYNVLLRVNYKLFNRELRAGEIKLPKSK